jgi:hypothetical protein
LMPIWSKYKNALLASKVNMAMAPRRRINENKYVAKFVAMEKQCWEMLKTGSSPKWRAVILHWCLNKGYPILVKHNFSIS